MIRGRVDCEGLEDSLRSDFSEITWVSAQVSGTRLVVKIKENEALLEIPVPDTEPCDIVAEKDGVITDMIVRSGTPAAAVGDRVTAGQVLIRGMVPVTDDSGAVVAEHPVRADGDVTVRTTQTYRREFGRWKTVEAMTGRVRLGLFVRVGNVSFRLFSPDSGKKQLEDLHGGETAAPHGELFSCRCGGDSSAPGSTFPTSVFTRRRRKRGPRPETAEEFAENLERKGVQIEENNARIIENGSGFQIEGRAVLLEPIGESREIQHSEIPAVEENDRTE